MVGVQRKAGASNCRGLLIDTDSQAHATLITTSKSDYGADNSLYTVLMADWLAAAKSTRQMTDTAQEFSSAELTRLDPVLDNQEQLYLREVSIHHVDLNTSVDTAIYQAEAYAIGKMTPVSGAPLQPGCQRRGLVRRSRGGQAR